MSKYAARLIYLDGVPTVKVETLPGRFLVGYFPIGAKQITYHGVPVDLADVVIEEGT